MKVLRMLSAWHSRFWMNFWLLGFGMLFYWSRNQGNGEMKMVPKHQQVSLWPLQVHGLPLEMLGGNLQLRQFHCWDSVMEKGKTPTTQLFSREFRGCWFGGTKTTKNGSTKTHLCWNQRRFGGSNLGAPSIHHFLAVGTPGHNLTSKAEEKLWQLLVSSRQPQLICATFGSSAGVWSYCWKPKRRNAAETVVKELPFNILLKSKGFSRRFFETRIRFCLPNCTNWWLVMPCFSCSPQACPRRIGPHARPARDTRSQSEAKECLKELCCRSKNP